MTTFLPELLRAMAAHARAAYPAECCGLVVEDGKGNLLFRPVANVAGSAQGQ